MARKNDCIYERGSSYQVKVPYYTEDEKTHERKRTFYCKTFQFKNYGTKQKALEMAKKHRDEIKVKIANNLIVKDKNMTLGEVYQIYKDSMQLSLETMRKYDSIYRVHILPYIDENKKFKDITFRDIQKTLNEMAMVLDNNSIGKALTLWKRLYKYAIFSDIVMKDETMKVSKPKSQKVVVKKDMTTTFEDIQNAIDNIERSVKNERNRYLFKTATIIIAYSGLRPAECFALEKSSIDFINNRIIVKSKIGSSKTERYTITKPKTEDSFRSVPFDETLAPVLKELIKNANSDYLFIKENGKFINGSEYSALNCRLSKKSFRAYTMRHQFITDLIYSGVDLPTIQNLAGHKNPTMTLAYARSNEEKKESAIKNRVFARKKEEIDIENALSVPKTVPKIN